MFRYLLIAASAFALCLGTAPAIQGEQAKESSVTDRKSDDLKPEIIEKVSPKYPEEAKKAKVMGKVIVEATVDTDGRVAEAKVVNEADARLAQAAIDAVKQWKFKPIQKDGKPVKVKTTVTLNFQLK